MVTSGPEELDVLDMVSVLNNVVMPRARELQRLGSGKDFVGSESADSRLHQQPLVLRERCGGATSHLLTRTESGHSGIGFWKNKTTLTALHPCAHALVLSQFA